ncbi:hypothetical protein [Streptomyces californicus]|uniref:effector-associated constant component EACC1 n=1 Tax=Streptomyces californicus TaxID=67351 RepID=UPI00332AC096
MSEYELRLAPDSGEDAEEQLRSLLHWLREDENLGPGVRGTLCSTAPPGAEDMGAGLDLVALIAGSALSSGSLVFSVLEWRAGRRRAPALVVRRGRVEVRIPADGAVDAEELRRIVAALGEDDGRTREPEGDDGTA